MSKVELLESLLEKIENQDFDFHKLFTKETTYYQIKDNKELSYEEFIEYCKNLKDLVVKRKLENNEFVKIEFEKFSFIAEVKDRRIKRMEIL